MTVYALCAAVTMLCHCPTCSCHDRNCSAFLLQVAAAAHAADGSAGQVTSSSSQQLAHSGSRQQPLAQLSLNNGAGPVAAALVQLGTLISGGSAAGQEQVPPQPQGRQATPGAASTVATVAPAGVPQGVADRLAAAKAKVRGVRAVGRLRGSNITSWALGSHRSPWVLGRPLHACLHCLYLH